MVNVSRPSLPLGFPIPWVVKLAINTFRRLTLMLCSLRVQELGESWGGYFTPASSSLAARNIRRRFKGSEVRTTPRLTAALLPVSFTANRLRAGLTTPRAEGGGQGAGGRPVKLQESLRSPAGFSGAVVVR
ncbi:hypothetical protein NDU88_005584 [Pleurodeles waltl]|uniref:Uncharacterized protein n=1 Tax=Pleurodeles waltl TaxID=8319 RepID=A0AAV7UIF9_PLEWA|nr:hypothetical protein NDU88_005584 [Pleurodeles waltl]